MKPSLTVVCGDFNARSNTWWIEDKSTAEGIQIDSISTYHSFQQIISDPTHLLPNSSSCIDLIFTDQTNMVVDSGVHPSLHQNCHHQIVYSKFNLKIEYPPPYERRFWNYSKANEECIRKSVENIVWERLLSNKTVHEQVILFNEFLLNIFDNFET